MHDALAFQLVATALGDPQPGQTMPLAATALRTAGIKTAGPPDADDDAVITAQWAIALGHWPFELSRISPPGRHNSLEWFHLHGISSRCGTKSLWSVGG